MGTEEASPVEDSDNDKAWGEEISSRLDEVMGGEVELTTFAQTRAKARTLLDDLRR